jgi:serine/threonine-protein kinase
MTAAPFPLSTALSDRYRIERELGAGGMATVYLAEDVKHRRKVALKVLHPELAAVLGAERFLHEIQVTAKLQHPHILGLFDSGAADGFLYYVMPYVDGESLRQRLTREKMLPIADALRIATEMASALDYAHRHGVIHRDIKPENILINEGEAMLADFGIALAVQEAGGDRITQTGLSLGTPQYMSPEQATGERDIDARSDQYSLGAVTYEMLAGVAPVSGPTARAIIAKLLTEKPASLRTFRDSVSPDFDAALLRALAKTPADRFASVKEFGAALSASSPPVAAPSAAARPQVARRSSKTRRVVLFTTIAAAVAAAVTSRSMWSTRAARTTAPTDGVQSVAVLPFVERNAEGGEFLGDGIAETLIYALGKVPGLTVAAQTSSFTFKGKEADLQTIGARLSVSSVLTGSVQRAGGRLRVTVRLENVADHRELWTERFDTEMKDVFALQDSIARAVVGRLQSSRQIGSTAIVAVGTKDVDAYQDYLQGRALWGQRGDGIRKGLAFFERAVGRDSGFALAWTGIADSYALLNVYGEMTAADAVPKAKFAVTRALALDSTLAAAHSANALLLQTYDYDWAGAEREFRRAIELDPRYVIGHYWYGNFLKNALGRPADAVVHMRQAVALDPLSPQAANLLSEALYGAGAPGAVDEGKRALSIARTWTNYRVLGLAFAASNRFREAVAAYDTALALAPGKLWVISARGIALGQAGDTAATASVYREMLNARAQPLHVALAAAWAGRDDDALRWMEMSRTTRDALLGYPYGNWWPAHIVGDPRFIAFWKRLGVSTPKAPPK